MLGKQRQSWESIPVEENPRLIHNTREAPGIQPTMPECMSEASGLKSLNHSSQNSQVSTLISRFLLIENSGKPWSFCDAERPCAYYDLRVPAGGAFLSLFSFHHSTSKS